eukprot:250681_1
MYMSSTGGFKEDLMKLSDLQLIMKCKENKLSHKGSKYVLIDRLLNHNKTNDSHTSTTNKRSKKSATKKTVPILSNITCNLLIHSYIRSIQNLISDQIIPQEIFVICNQYLAPSNIFIVLKRNNKTITDALEFGIVQLSNEHINEKRLQYHKSKIMHLDKSNTINNIMRWETSFCSGKNIKLPDKITKKIAVNNTEYDIIFVCGGKVERFSEYYTNNCNAFIISRSHENEFGGYFYNWKLPNLKKKVFEHNILYNNKYGLICIGGQTEAEWRERHLNTVYKLSFNNKSYTKQNKKQWKWKKIQNMQTYRVGAAAICIGTKLIVFGGHNHGWNGNHLMNVSRYKQSVEMIDLSDEFSNSEWKYLNNMNYGRYKPGICCNENLNKIYISGGLNAYDMRTKENMCDVECYDMMKDKWLNIALTQCKSTENSVLWIDNNLLYIASKDFKSMECIDLRGTSVMKSEKIKLRIHRGTTSGCCVRLY